MDKHLTEEKQAIYLGLDISKHKIDCYFKHSNKPYHMVITNNLEGYQKIISLFDDLEIPLSCIHACCESTSKYHINIAKFLATHEVQMSIANPRSVHAYFKENLCRTKTDKQDAKLIAQYCEQRNPKLWQPEEPHWQEIKNLHRRVEQLNQLLVSEKNRLAISDEYTQAYIEEMIEHITKQIQSCHQRIDHIISEKQELLEKIRILNSIPGVGSNTSRILLYLLHDIERFPSSKHLISFVGLAPVVKESGRRHSKTRISKMGDRFIRKALYFPARAACTVSKQWKPWYKQKLQEGKHPKEIYILMMCKILKYAYICLKNNTMFDSNRHQFQESAIKDSQK